VALAAERVVAALASAPRIAPQQPRDAEVAEQRVPRLGLPVPDGWVAREEHVLGLEVAVHHAVRVRVGERLAQLEGDAQRVGRRERPLAGEPLAQRLALDERHHVVERPRSLARVVQRQDVRVLQPRQHADLAVEALVPVPTPATGTSTLSATRRLCLWSCAT
jgi:hypothetical protein